MKFMQLLIQNTKTFWCSKFFHAIDRQLTRSPNNWLWVTVIITRIDVEIWMPNYMHGELWILFTKNPHKITWDNNIYWAIT